MTTRQGTRPGRRSGSRTDAAYPPDPGLLDRVFRHLSTIEIDLDELEVEVDANLPTSSDALGEKATTISRTLALKDHPGLERAVKALVEEVKGIFSAPAKEVVPNRCDRCVKSDCCSFERIHLTEEEAAAILAHLGEPATAQAMDRYFVHDPDIGGYFQRYMRHRGGHCTFLKKDGARMRCSIYEVRPQTCRDYDAGTCTVWTEMLPASACGPGRQAPTQAV